MARRSMALKQVWVLALGVVLLGTAPPLQAAPCACDSPEVVAAFASLSQQVADLGLREALGAQSGEAEDLLYENLKLRLSSQRRVPRECLPQLLAQAGASSGSWARAQLATTSVNLPNAAPMEGHGYSSHGLYEIYRSLSGSVYDLCSDRSGPDRERCHQLVPKVSAKTRAAAFSSPSSWEISRYNLSDSDFRALRAYHRSLESLSGDALLARAEAGELGLTSFAEKRMFLEILGHQLLDNYDKARADFSSDRSAGVVTNDRLLSAARQSSWAPEEYRRFGADPGSANPAGVCRDIHAFLGQLAEKLGMRNVYLIQYATRSNQHVVLTYQTPEPGHEQEVIRQNYGRSTQVSGVDGARAVQFLGKDAATHYRIYSPSGKFLKDTPTELGKFLAASSGFSHASSDDPLKDRQGTSSVAVRARLVDSSEGQLALGVAVGVTDSGQQALDVSLQGARGQGGLAPTQIGVGVARVGAPRFLDDPSLAIPDAWVLHTQAQQRLQTDLIPVGGSGDLRLGVHAGLQGNVVLTPGEGASDSSQLTFQAGVKTGWDATLRLKSEDGALQSRVKLGQTLAVGQSDVRDLGVWGLYLDSNFVQVTESLKVAPDLSVFAEGQLVHSELSVRGRLDVGLTGEHFIGSAFVSGRFDSDAPLLEDQSLRRAGVDLGLSPVTGLAVQLGVQAPLEGENALSGTRVMAGVKGNLPW